MFLLTLTAACLGAADAAKPEFDFKLEREEVTASALVENGRVVFVVNDPRGIGGLTVGPKTGKWPAEVVFRLRYLEGKGFRNLESFGFQSSRFSIVGSLKASGKMYFYLPDADGKFPTEAGVAGTLDVTAEVKDGYLEIVLPKNTLTGTEKITVGWIDAFRR
jgi:hypothetical protein